MVPQSVTPLNLSDKPRKEDLISNFKGKGLDGLRTPALIIDRKVFAENCASMHAKAKAWGASFRAHLKTHKTVEGTQLQLISKEGKTSAVVVSTMMEAWEVVQAGLVSSRTVTDILYGLPVAVNKIADLSALRREVEQYGGVVRILVDHIDQLHSLEDYEDRQPNPRRWSVFIKIDGAQNRAGVLPDSADFFSLVRALLNSPAISLHGFYGHAGDAYASTSLPEASRFLSSEVQSVNLAAAGARPLLERSQYREAHTQPFVLSVGSTPTAHAASAETRKLTAQILHGSLELHAGNYPMLDLQQQHTGLIGCGRIAQRVRATVISYYPGRGADGTDEAMIDAGAIAFSKDTGPLGGYGEVIGRPWRLSRISQEHGVLTQSSAGATRLKLGTLVDIVGQHACLIAAAYPWFYIVDSDIKGGSEIVDVWVPWKGW